jgi:hypothetical protein
MSGEKCDTLIVKNDLVNFVCHITEYAISPLIYIGVSEQCAEEKIRTQTVEVTEQKKICTMTKFLIRIPRQM